ncbi:MAG: YwiC-like family protein [Deinococcus sp.]|nr:YwiC-like family protein [Deinococcus sp.]
MDRSIAASKERGTSLSARIGAVCLGLLGWPPGPPPLPHEHGAWLMLYAPLVISFLAVRPGSLVPPLLLTLLVTGAFLGQNAARLLIRRRRKEGAAFWLGIYLALLAAGAIPLLFRYRLSTLLPVGGLATGLFGLHTLLSFSPAGKRQDRSLWGEILAVGALTLTGPAAYIVSRQALDSLAWYIWAGSVAYFSSGIFYVHMLLSAARVKGSFGSRDRWRLGGAALLYHLLLAILVAVVAITGGQGGRLTAIAYTPAMVRAFWGWATLSNTLPPLKQVGLREACYTLWFTGFFPAALLVSS